jgi:hypothetical protein
MTKKRMKSCKITVDVERQKAEVSDLTEDEKRALAGDIRDQMKALQQRWEASADPAALAVALTFYSAGLPEWLFKALRDNLEQQLRNPDETRFLAVRYAHDVFGMTTDEAYDWAADNVTGPAAGRRDAMMKGYQIIAKQVAAIDQIQPRPRKRRR